MENYHLRTTPGSRPHNPLKGVRGQHRTALNGRLYPSVRLHNQSQLNLFVYQNYVVLRERHSSLGSTDQRPQNSRRTSTYLALPQTRAQTNTDWTERADLAETHADQPSRERGLLRDATLYRLPGRGRGEVSRHENCQIA